MPAFRHRHPPFVVLALGLCGLTLAPSVRADHIVLDDGRALEGTVRQHGADPALGGVVTIETTGGQITVPASQIESITPSTPASAALMESRDAFRAQRFDAAVRALGRVLDAGGAAAGPAGLIQRHGPALASNIDILSTPTRATLTRVLDAIDASPTADNPQTMLSVAWLQLALGDVRAATPRLTTLAGQYLPNHPDSRSQLAAWVNDRLNRLERRNHFEDGLPLVDAMVLIDPQLADTKRVEFRLRWGRYLRNDNRFAEALGVYRDLIPYDQKAASQFTQRALEAAESYYTDRNRQDQLLALLENQGLAVVPDFASKRIVQILRNEGAVALRRKDYAAARQDFEHANRVIPHAADELLERVEFQQRRDALAADDPIGHFQLGDWALGKGLLDEALEMFQTAESSDIVGRNAKVNIEAIRNKQAKRDLDRLLDLYSRGLYNQTLEGIYAFQQKPYAPGYQDQAKRLNAITMEALRMASQEKPQQAQAIFQQAHRAFLKQDYQEAGKKLQVILDNYADTIVYPSARNLMARVREAQALQALEQGRPAPAEGGDLATTPASTTGNASTTPTVGAEIEQVYRSIESLHKQ